VRFGPKLTLLFALLAILPIVVVGYLAYDSGRRTIESETIKHLVSINLMKNSEMNRWIEDSKQSLLELAQRPLLRQYTAVLASRVMSDPAYQQAYGSIIRDHMQTRLEYGNFYELFLISAKNGIILASTDEKQVDKYRDTQPYFIEGKNRAYVQGVYYAPELEQSAMTAAVPVIDMQGNLTGVLAGRLDLGELSKIVSLSSGLNRTEDSYIVNSFNFFVTEPRFGQNYALRKAVRTEGVEAGLAGKEGTSFYRDYRDIPVIGAYKWLPEYNMCLMTEIDQADAYAPVDSMGWTIAIIAFIIALLAIFTGFYIARSITRPLQNLALGASEIGRGNLDYRVGTTAKDEIGILSRELDSMAGKLINTMVSRDSLEAEVAERKRAEKSLIYMSARQEAILASVPDIIMEVDNNKIYTWANSAGWEFFGTDVIGKEAAHYFEGEQNTYKKVQPLFNGDENTIYIESWQRRKDGQKRLLAWWCRMLKDGDGKVTGALSTARDITEQKRAEEEVLRLNAELDRRVRERTAQLETANRELEAFAYSVSHDLRAPLRGIDGWSLALLEDHKDKLDGQSQQHLGRVRSEVQKMGRLIDDLLLFSRQSRSEMKWQRLDMTAMAENITARIQQSYPGHPVEFIIQPEIMAEGDFNLLDIALFNLLDNAAKFSSHNPLSLVEFGRTGKDGVTVFFVRDNGVGFDMAYADKLFGVFQRLHRSSEFPGTGIGLALVKRIINRHEGRIWAESVINQGSTFYFTLKEAA
jgi:PAS domain S-box-containing protein